jgi:hypothetical protein
MSPYNKYQGDDGEYQDYSYELVSSDSEEEESE